LLRSRARPRRARRPKQSLARAAPSGTRGATCGGEPRTRRAVAAAECQCNRKPYEMTVAELLGNRQKRRGGMKILVLNAGSSSLKCVLYELDAALPATPPDPLWEATAEWSADSDTVDLSVCNAQGATLHEERLAGKRSDLLFSLLGM